MIQTVAARAVGWRSEMSAANRPHGPARLPFLGVAENDGRHKRVYESGYCFVAAGSDVALFSYSSRLGNFTLALFA